MDEHHVGILGADLVEALNDRRRVGDVLAAGAGDEGALRQVGLGLAVLAGADEVAGVDGGGGQMAGLAGVRSGPGPPGVAGLDAVGFGGLVAQGLEGVASVTEAPRAVGRELHLQRPDLGAVLCALEVAEFGGEPVGGAVEALCLSVEHVDEASEEALAFVGHLGAVRGDAFGHRLRVRRAPFASTTALGSRRA